MKKAFTLLELVFVIVVIGIIAATVIPRTNSNSLQEAAIQVVSHIRYTQHLAMIDDKFNKDDANWYKKRWQIIFADYTHANPNKNIVAYSIFSDESLSGKPDVSEMANDTLSIGDILSGGHSNLNSVSSSDLNSKLNLKETYGITSYDLTAGCNIYNNSRISFDHLGRPLRGDLKTIDGAYFDSYNRIISQRCDIILESPEGNITIAIEPETGYTHIL
ncbi:MAG: prepilin-type N-terminal cleavage/methylation domain-containing protein [Sulfurimonas sp.]|nr:prepilin-type N-terminal cleavage/methylation domain-containing protein [Sulfurimonas sp.]